MLKLSKSWHYYLLFLISLFSWIDAVQVHLYTNPLFVSGSVVYPGKLPESWTEPPYFKYEKGLKTKFILRETIYLRPWFPRVFQIYPQDILWHIQVNGHDIQSNNLPLAVIHSEGHTFDLGPFLHPGLNQIELEMEVEWGTVSFHSYVSPWDWSSIITFIFIALGVSTAIYLSLWMLRVEITPIEYYGLCGGILLQFIYMSGTPFFIRAYDVGGHTGYIDYVAEHFSIPDPNLGWETFQPPTYYFALGTLTKALGASNWNLEQRCALWQIFSCLSMSGALIGAFIAGRIVFPGNKGESRAAYLALISVLPAFVFNASRVSNDVLFDLFGFWWFASLVWFWKQPSWRRSLTLWTIMDLALITKANGLTFLVITAICIALHPDLSLPTRLKRLGLMTAVFAAGAGWYYFPRLLIEHRTDEYIVGNIQHLNPKSHLDNVFWNSLVFNPFKILEYPFVQPWGPRHEFFWEYFFKSAFLGEWWMSKAYKWVARLFMLSALLLLIKLVWDTWRFAREFSWENLPIFTTLALVLVFQWVFLQFAPFMSTQDFRYSLILIIPLSIILNNRSSTLLNYFYMFTLFNCMFYILNIALS